MTKMNERLAEVIPEVIESGKPIVDIEIVPSKFATKNEVNVINVQVNNGSKHRFFAKNFGVYVLNRIASARKIALSPNQVLDSRPPQTPHLDRSRQLDATQNRA